MKMKVAWTYPLPSPANEIHVKVLVAGNDVKGLGQVATVPGRDDACMEGYVGTVNHADGIHVLHFFIDRT